MASKKEVFGVDVTGDISGLAKAMKDAERLMKSTERSLKNINDAVKFNPTDSKLIEEQRDVYKKAIKENAEELKKFQDIRKQIVNDPNFKKGITDMSEKFTSIEKKIQKVTARGKELKNEFAKLPSEAIAKVEDKFKKLGESVKQSKDALEKIKASLKNVNQQIKLDPTNLDLYTKKTTLLNNELRVTEGAIANIKKRQIALQDSDAFFKGKDDVRKEWTENALLLQMYMKRAKELRQELQRELTPSMQAFVNVVTRAGEKMTEISKKTSALSRAFQALGVASIKSAIDYESNIANIRRVVSDLSDDTIADLKNIAIETGNAFKDISDYATIGGALGLAEKDLAKFTETMIDLNTATGGVFAGEEGAKGIAVFLKQLNLGIDQAENFGSAIAVIGDAYADIGDETVNVATRLTGLNSIINTNQYELIGLAGVMADLGLATDSNANGINRAFLQIDKIIGGGVKNSKAKLEEMAAVAGLTSKQFKEAWGKDAVDTFLRFTDGLKTTVFNEINDGIGKSTDQIKEFSEVLGVSTDQFEKMWSKDAKSTFDQLLSVLGDIGDDGVVASKVLSDLGISSVNTAQTLLRLSGSGNEVRKAINLTREAWEKNTALTEKSNRIYDTTAYKLKSMWESLKQLGGVIGDEVLPDLKRFADYATNAVKSFSKLDPAIKSLTAKFIGLLAGISPVTKALGGLTKIIPGLVGFLTSPTGLIAALGLLVASGFAETETAMDKLVTKSNDLNEAFNESINVANRKYESDNAYLVTAEKYVETIDQLREKLKDTNLTEEESGRIKKDVADYVDRLNALLGDEYYQFDLANGELLYQGKLIDSAKQKYEEFAFAVKKNSWIESHKGVLEEAYANIDTANQGMIEAAETFRSNYDGIAETDKQQFDHIKELMLEHKGNVEEVTKILNNGELTNIDEGLARMISQAKEGYDKMVETLDKYTEIKKKSDEIIKNFEEVETSTMENFEERTGTLLANYSLLAQDITDINQGLLDKEEVYQILTETVHNENGENQDLLDLLLKQWEQLNENKEKLYEMSGHTTTIKDEFKKFSDDADTWAKYEDDKNKLAEMAESTGDIKSDFDSFASATETWAATPLVKQVIYDISYRGTLLDDALPRPGGASWRSGGFDSHGYGDLLKSTMASISGALGGIRSGGFRSSGINVVNNFSISSNNIGRNDVREWSSWIIDDINEALGRQM